MSSAISKMLLAVAVLVTTGVPSHAQTTTSTETKTFEVIAVDGNQLVVKLPEGTRQLTVPADFRFIVNGQPLSVGQLQPGMTGTATITTRTTMTPVTVTEVRNGTVLQRASGTIVVRIAETNEVKRFSQADVTSRNMTIMRDGKPAKVEDFREGDRLSATIITTRAPQVMTEREVAATLAARPAPAPAAPPAAAPPRAAASAPVPSAAATPQAEPPQTVARSLPKTASSWPLLGFASILSLAAGLVLTARRRWAR